ncbi:MAG: DUF4160 domain-containing protein [Nitrospirae bacterium]|nr:DUF4160 domain-containing protein [Nitrospirota bacterium]
MPTILNYGPYRFYFYAGDGDEPPHVHVERDANIAKFWLDPVRLENSGRFSRKEINDILAIIHKRRDEMQRSWDEFFSH